MKNFTHRYHNQGIFSQNWDSYAPGVIVNRLLERFLRIIYGDKQSSFEELLEKDSSASIHERNIQILATKMYKVSKGMSPPQITELFARKNEHPYTLNFDNHL